MRVDVLVDAPARFRVDLARDIRALLGAVPQGDLAGLTRVVVSGERGGAHPRTPLAEYYPSGGAQGAWIHLAAGQALAGIPRLLILIRPFRRFVLGWLLFHEIGHHVHWKGHGRRKGQWESFAEEYARRVARRTWPGTRILAVAFRPIARLFRIDWSGPRL